MIRDSRMRGTEKAELVSSEDNNDEAVLKYIYVMTENNPLYILRPRIPSCPRTSAAANREIVDLIPRSRAFHSIPP